MSKKKPSNAKQFTAAQIARIGNNLAQLSRKQLPVFAAMWVQAMIRQVQPVYSKIEARRLELLDQYAEKMNDGTRKEDEHGNVILTDQEGFDKAFDGLMEKKYTIACKPLPITALEPRSGDMLIAPFEINGLEEAGLLVIPEG